MSDHLPIDVPQPEEHGNQQVHRFLSDYGINSQKSVFEMIVTEPEYREVYGFLK